MDIRVSLYDTSAAGISDKSAYEAKCDAAAIETKLGHVVSSNSGTVLVLMLPEPTGLRAARDEDGAVRDEHGADYGREEDQGHSRLSEQRDRLRRQDGKIRTTSRRRTAGDAFHGPLFVRHAAVHVRPDSRFDISFLSACRYAVNPDTNDIVDTDTLLECVQRVICVAQLLISRLPLYSVFRQNSQSIVENLEQFKIKRIQGVTVQEKVSQMGATEIAILALSSIIFLGTVLAIALLCSTCKER